MSLKVPFSSPISEDIWRRKYRSARPDGCAEHSLAETLQRVARAAAQAEKGGRRKRERWAAAFLEAMADLEFIPAGRILAGAGSGRDVTLFNCFVMGAIEDDLAAIFDCVKEAALTMQAGGGVGMDFSTLRPRGAPVRSIGADASGPVSFMDVWDAMCRTIMSAGARRGAMMATMRADHPDIEDFIAAKSGPGRLRNFNLSVLVTEAFLAAVRMDADWPLVFRGEVYRTLRARELWQLIMRSTYEFAEPGVIFIDRVNALDNLSYCETISATNPCGEQPLPPYGACLLGSINLAALVTAPFTASAALDLARLERRVAIGVRMLDDLIDIARYPLAPQKREALSKRRVGLGVTGLADALAFVGLRYDSAAARETAGIWMGAIADVAYRASAELAAEKGSFPLYDREAFLAAPFVAGLGKEARAAIARHGIRNGCLTSVAPTGTISLLAGNVSSGIEPIYDYRYSRFVLDAQGERREQTVEDFAYARFRSLYGVDAPLPPAFVTAGEVSPSAHVAMQAAVQRHVDSSISKTINVPEDLPFGAFEAIYLEADELGLKGCTTYRPNPVTGAVLVPAPDERSRVGRTASETMTAASVVPAPLVRPEAVAGADETVPAAVHPADGALRQSRPSPSTPESAARTPVSRGGGGVVYMAPPLERDAVLQGFTYKLEWPASNHAIYVTINDIERDGRRRPFEIFVNTRNLEHYVWTVALTRMISAVFRRGGDVSFIAEELQAVFDPQGGQWMGGRYVPSLLAAIGDVVERHLVEIGFRGADAGRLDAGADRPAEVTVERSGSVRGKPGAVSEASLAREGDGVIDANDATAGRRAQLCPRCSSPQLVRQEGCLVCRDCGFAKCG
jgi:ribonucleoside-diphosphate reductase alpha chain